MADGDFSASVDFTAYVPTENSPGDCNVRGESDLENEFFLPKHFAPLLESGNYSDAVLVVSSQQFPVHKDILSARSSVFLELFSHAGKDPVVEAIDVDPDVMKEALRYIYTGRVRNLESISNELLRVAALSTRSTDCRRCVRRACAGASASITRWTFSDSAGAVRLISWNRRPLCSLLRTSLNSCIHINSRRSRTLIRVFLSRCSTWHQIIFE